MSHIEAREKLMPLNMRVESRKRNLIDMAVAELGGDRTSFVIDAAYRRAEEILLDRRLFMLDPESFDTFEKALEATVEENPCLMNLMGKKKPWE